MTLDEILKVGKEVLNNYPNLRTLTNRRGRVEPIHEKVLDGPSVPGRITPESVAEATVTVLAALAKLPEGSWTYPPELMKIDVLEPKAIYRGSVAIRYLLQYDGTKLQEVLHVGGFILEEERGATARS